MRNAVRHLSLVALIGILLASSVFAKRVSLEIGMPSPKWEKLKGTDDKEHSLDTFNESKAIVVVFTSNYCHVSKLYQARFARLADDFREKKVAFVAINANKDEDLKAMQSYAKEKKIKYHYLRDETQKVAKSFGASLTPEVFLLDADRNVAYMGAVDDDRALSGKPKKHYLRDAIEAVLAAKEPPVSKSRAIGCTIRWK